MSDPLRTDGSRAHADVASGADRDAKIEQLLLVGLDHYFAARYELAINVWTRALFLDRSHARARAYIDRARSALAERQRESEELLQNGVAAFQRGDGDEARRLLQAAIDGGAPSEEALAVLDRLNRLEAGRRRRRPAFAAIASGASKRRARCGRPRDRSAAHSRWSAMVVLAIAIVTARPSAAWNDLIDWRSLVALTRVATRSEPVPAAASVPVVRERRAAAAAARRDRAAARPRADRRAATCATRLTALDGVRPTDPQRPTPIVSAPTSSGSCWR